MQGAGAERTGTLQGPRATRPRVPDAPSKPPTERAMRALKRVVALVPALLNALGAVAGLQIPAHGDAGDMSTTPDMLQRLLQGRCEPLPLVLYNPLDVEGHNASVFRSVNPTPDHTRANTLAAQGH